MVSTQGVENSPIVMLIVWAHPQFTMLQLSFPLTTFIQTPHFKSFGEAWETLLFLFCVYLKGKRFPIWCLMFKKQVSIKMDYSSDAFIDNLRFYWLLNKFRKEKTGRFCRDIWQLSCFLSDLNLRTVLQVVGHIFPFLPPFYDKHFCTQKKNNLQIITPTPFP